MSAIDDLIAQAEDRMPLFLLPYRNQSKFYLSRGESHEGPYFDRESILLWGAKKRPCTARLHF